jgi:hypothetical protein
MLTMTLTGLLLVIAGCASTLGSETSTTGESAKSDSCGVSMVRDYAREASSASPSASEAIATWVTFAQASAAQNIARSTDPADRGVIADRATLDALKWVSGFLNSTQVVVDEASGSGTAHATGTDASGRSFLISLSSGSGDEPELWYVTGYEIDLDKSWCPLLPDSKK